MQKLQNKKGFTLIELLVVITIMGILATGGMSVFTKQLQGARDTTRMTNIKLLSTAAVQYQSDNSEYPNNGINSTSSGTFKSQVNGYMTKYPEDPKTGQNICWDAVGSAAGGPCGVWYAVNADSNQLRNSAFKLAMSFEKEENATGATSPAIKDGGNSGLNGYFEIFGGAGGDALISTSGTGVASNTNTAKLY